jgi:hypothetical protein
MSTLMTVVDIKDFATRLTTASMTSASSTSLSDATEPAAASVKSPTKTDSRHRTTFWRSERRL